MDNNRNLPRRPDMTPEQKRAYEARRRAYIERKRAEEEEQKQKKRHIIICTVVFVLTLALLTGIAALIISLVMHSDDVNTPKEYVFRIDGEKSAATINNGIVYIDMTALKSKLRLTESSSSATVVKYTVRTTKNNITFSDGSATAIVNGSMNVAMPGAATVSKDECRVPLETVSYLFSGITVTRKGSRITMEHNEQVDILAKSNDPISMIIEFSANLDAYEAYMNPQGAERDKYLVLVNKNNPLGNSYVPDDLVVMGPDIFSGRDESSLIVSIVEKAVTAMLAEMKAEGINSDVYAFSGYRSFGNQKSLFEGYFPGMTLEQAMSQTLDTAYPGYSEHQSGLCVDLMDTGYPPLTNPFTDNKTYTWLLNNAWKFGFILRFPSDKVQETGYSYESWHFRYVGRYHAEKIYRSGMSLEAYVASLDSE